MSADFSICLYCGSSKGRDPVYLEAGSAFGRAVAKAGARLVYGAGDKGVMGAAATAALDAGGEVFGVIPDMMVAREWGKTDIQHFIRVETMHERKKVMFANSEAVAVLPGGLGTLDEFFEVYTWRKLHMHDKPIVLVNVKGFWEPLLSLLDHLGEQGFLRSRPREDLVVTTPEEAPERLMRMARGGQS